MRPNPNWHACRCIHLRHMHHGHELCINFALFPSQLLSSGPIAFLQDSVLEWDLENGFVRGNGSTVLPLLHRDDFIYSSAVFYQHVSSKTMHHVYTGGFCTVPPRQSLQFCPSYLRPLLFRGSVICSWRIALDGLNWDFMTCWFMMIHNYSWWFMVIYGAYSWWFMMNHDDSWWFTVIHGDSWWHDDSWVQDSWFCLCIQRLRDIQVMC